MKNIKYILIGVLFLIGIFLLNYTINKPYFIVKCNKDHILLRIYKIETGVYEVVFNEKKSGALFSQKDMIKIVGTLELNKECKHN